MLAYTTYILDSIGNYVHQSDHGELPTESGRILYFDFYLLTLNTIEKD